MISLGSEGDNSVASRKQSAPAEKGSSKATETEPEVTREDDGADGDVETKANCQGAKLEEQENVLETQKAFQRIANQLSLQPLPPQQPHPNAVGADVNARLPPELSAAAMTAPFLLRQRLDSLSPFLAALHQQQIQQQLLYGNLPGAAQLAMMANIGAATAGMLPTSNVSDGRSRGESNASAASSGGGLSPDTSRPLDTQHNTVGDNEGEDGLGIEDDAEGGGYCEARTKACAEPEDLSIGEMRPRRPRENGSSPSAAGNNNGWSYEEQFKQDSEYYTDM